MLGTLEAQVHWTSKHRHLHWCHHRGWRVLRLGELVEARGVLGPEDDSGSKRSPGSYQAEIADEPA